MLKEIFRENASNVNFPVHPSNSRTYAVFSSHISNPAMLVAQFFGGNQLHKFVPTGFSVIYLLNWSFFLREILSPQFLIAFKFPYWSRILFMYLLSRCLGTYAQGILWNLIPPKNFMDS